MSILWWRIAQRHSFASKVSKEAVGIENPLITSEPMCIYTDTCNCFLCSYGCDPYLPTSGGPQPGSLWCGIANLNFRKGLGSWSYLKAEDSPCYCLPTNDTTLVAGFNYTQHTNGTGLLSQSRNLGSRLTESRAPREKAAASSLSKA